MKSPRLTPLPGRRTILYCNPFNQEISGADESLLTLVDGLDRQRYRPIVVLPGPSPYEKRYRQLGVDVFHLPIFGIKRSVLRLWPFGLFFVPASLGLLRLITRERVDLVHNNMSVVLQGGAGSRLAGIPSLFHVRSTSIAQPPLACDLLVRAIELLGDQVIAISAAIALILRSHGLRRPLHVIPDAVDLDGYTEVAEVAAAPPAGRVVATMGRINPRKGYEHFIDAAALIHEARPEVRFLVFGGTADKAEEHYLEWLRRRVAERGLGSVFRFAGHTGDVPSAMAACDVFLMTSVDEGFGRVVIEAMAAGRPVVGSAVGGIRELIRDGETGYLVPAADPAGFAAATLGYLGDIDKLLLHGRAARAAVSGFGVPAHARRIEAIYEDLLAGRRGPGSTAHKSTRRAADSRAVTTI